LPLRWRSRIAVWDPPLRFVDEQLRGPYRHWRHEHLFEEEPGGTRCRDVVEYNVLGGRLVHRFLVRPDLLKIFAYRQRALEEYFTTKHTNDTKGGKNGR
jgi:ligand-binding SRPBCC domain-containing protein